MHASHFVWLRWLVCSQLALALGSTFAQSVAMTGSMGSKALLVIDGGAPKALSGGESYQGVKVVSVASDRVLVETTGGNSLQFSVKPRSLSVPGRLAIG